MKFAVVEIGAITDESLMRMTITYTSSRSELWRWYWQLWRSKLWKMHAQMFIVFVIAASVALYDGPPRTLSSLAAIVAVGTLPFFVSVTFPQLKFKSQVRTLTADEGGLDSTIGNLHVSVPWNDVSEVREDGPSLIIMRTNMNAFIVPDRAFSSAKEQAEFRDFIRTKVRSAVS